MSEEEVSRVEDSAIAAVLAMVVRLSESSFRPMFYKVQYTSQCVYNICILVPVEYGYNDIQHTRAFRQECADVIITARDRDQNAFSRISFDHL